MRPTDGKGTRRMTDGPDGPAADDPATDGPAADGPATDGPAADGPATDGPAPSKRTPPTPDRTRTGRVWVGVVLFALLLVLLLIFIVQNTQSVHISYFAASGSLPLAVAMLVSAVAGVLLTATAGSLRIWQLRRQVRHDNGRDTIGG